MYTVFLAGIFGVHGRQSIFDFPWKRFASWESKHNVSKQPIAQEYDNITICFFASKTSDNIHGHSYNYLINFSYVAYNVEKKVTSPRAVLALTNFYLYPWINHLKIPGIFLTIIIYEP